MVAIGCALAGCGERSGSSDQTPTPAPPPQTIDLQVRELLIGGEGEGVDLDGDLTVDNNLPAALDAAARDHEKAGEDWLERLGIGLPRFVADPARELGPYAGRYGLELEVERLERLKARVFGRLEPGWPGVSLRFDLGRLHAIGYYETVCLHLEARDLEGIERNIGDGGRVPWTGRLLSNRKERLVTSALGAELLCKRFRLQPRGQATSGCPGSAAGVS